eukprot:scaffold820_cov376-Prasinococcus_capsulatus_cf.AAC.13
MLLWGGTSDEAVAVLACATPAPTALRARHGRLSARPARRGEQAGQRRQRKERRASQGGQKAVTVDVNKRDQTCHGTHSPVIA